MTEANIATLTVEKGEGAGETFWLGDDVITIGRGQEDNSTIALSHQFISRRHAQIRYSDGHFFIQDLNSKNGTRVNGVSLEPMTDCRLGNNDVINMANGTVLIRFKQLSGLQSETIENMDESISDTIVVDHHAREAWVNGKKLDPVLTKTEFDLLSFLFNNRNKACSKDDIAAHVWEEEFITDQQIEQYIYRLRRRIEADPNDPGIIVTMRGYGYKLVIT